VFLEDATLKCRSGVVVLGRTSLSVSVFSPPSDFQEQLPDAVLPLSRRGCALRRSSSACDSFGPIRRMTKPSGVFEKNGFI
jgi:hypothetical protein